MGVGGHKRILVMLGFVLCLCGFARPALAAPKVGKVVNGSGDSATVDVQVIGSGISNGFSAAAWSFGVDPASLTTEQKAKLSNESTGGAFYRYAMAFQSGAHEPITVGLSSWYAVTLPQFVWTLEGYPYGDYAQARRDLKTIRDGGDVGGGGGGESGDVPPYFEVTNVDYFGGRDLSTAFTVARGQYEPSNVSWRIPVSGVVASRLMDFVTTYDKVIAVVWRNGRYVGPNVGAQQTNNISVWFYASNDISTSYANNVTYGIGKKFSASYSLSGDLVNGFNAPDSWTYTSLTNVPNGDTFDVSNRIAYAYWFRGGQIGPPAPPENHWPDVDPTPTPDPPEVPGPSDDPIPQPDPPDLPNPVTYPVSDPYTPDPDPPTNPIITYDPDPTGDSLDYRPWLNAILKLLRTINTSINDGFYNVDVWLTEHCDHIREMMHKEALTLGLKMQAAINNGFVSFERWLQSTYGPYFFDELDATLRAILADYEDYLYDLFVWLSEQFDFSVSGGSGSYDDSTLLYWLQQIWAILAEKPSVGTEPDSFFDWLANLLAGILGGLVAWLLGALGGMADAVSGLATKFPFSLPWDIATMLALFVHEPVTPVFDLPFALPGEYANVRVDMSYFDEVMAAVRGVELVLFGLALAKRTPEMLDLADTVFS